MVDQKPKKEPAQIKPRKEMITPSSGLKINWKGMVELDELYKAIKSWLEEKGFFKEEESEKRYVERRFPGFKHIEIRWETRKKESSYVTDCINLNFLMIAVSEAEVQLPNGVKKKMQKGDFGITITSYLELGGKGWEEMKALEKFYYNNVMRKKINVSGAGLYNKTVKLQAMIKEFFEKYQ